MVAPFRSCPAMRGWPVRALVLGAVTGGLAIAKRDQAREECGATTFDAGRCPADRAGSLMDARLAAQIATPALIVAGTCVAAGVTVLILEEKKALNVGVAVSPGYLSVHGMF
jgi:hypothetical protein